MTAAPARGWLWRRAMAVALCDAPRLEETMARTLALIAECDELLTTLGSMGSVYADHAGIVKAIGMRTDAVLEHRARLMGVRDELRMMGVEG